MYNNSDSSLLLISLLTMVVVVALLIIIIVFAFLIIITAAFRHLINDIKVVLKGIGDDLIIKVLSQAPVDIHPFNGFFYFLLLHGLQSVLGNINITE